MNALDAAAAALDPNWFYSSLAQSAATFAGLFGGILATNLQAQQEPAAEQRERAVVALRTLYSELKEQRKHLTDYRKHAEDQIAATRAAQAKGETEVTFPRFYHPYGSVVNSGQPCADGVIRVEEVRLQFAQAFVPILDDLHRATSRIALLAFLDASIDLRESEAEGMGAKVNGLCERAEMASRELEVLELRTQTATWWALLTFLGGLTFVGVVWPLFELLERNSCGTRALALSIVFAIILLGLLAYVLSQILRLRAWGRFDSIFPPVAHP